jgi:hypothetical protein
MKSTGHSNRAPLASSATGGPDIRLIVLRTHRPAVRPPEPPIPVYFPLGRRLTGKQGPFVAEFALLTRNLRDLQRGDIGLKPWVENLQPGMAFAIYLNLRGRLFIPPLDGAGGDPGLTRR